jgi:hypothetical protein
MKNREQYRMVADEDPQFARFWAAYPRRVAKKDARRAWAQIRPSSAVVDQMITALAWQAQQPAWLKDGGAFVPYPASWLNAERWTDEQSVAVQAPQRQMSNATARVFQVLMGDDAHE